MNHKLRLEGACSDNSLCHDMYKYDTNGGKKAFGALRGISHGFESERTGRRAPFLAIVCNVEAHTVCRPLVTMIYIFPRK